MNKKFLKNAFANTGKLTRFVLRRERIVSAVWIAALSAFSIAVALVLKGMFATEAERLVMAETMKNPAMVALLGPVFSPGSYTLGVMFANEMLLITIVISAVMNIFLVIRHTRADEETGSSEIVRSLPVGRLANLAAVMITAVAVNAALALITGIGLGLLGIEGMGFGGSVLYGAALGTAGLFFASAAAVFSQLSSGSRGAITGTFILLAVCFVLRAAGDVKYAALSYISPLGLILRSEAYAANKIWPVIAVLLLSALLTAAAFYLNAIRDAGQGFLQAKPGKKNASALLRSPFGLSLKLLRNSLILWTCAMLAFGIMYGAVMGDMESFIAGNEFLQQILPQSPDFTSTELFLSMLMSVMSMLGAVPVISAMLRLRGEEKANRSEHLLARPVSKLKLMSGYFIIAVVSSFVMLFAAAFGLWAASGAVMENPVAFGTILSSITVFLPAVWFLLCLAVLLTGILPDYTVAVWGYLGFSLFVVYIGRIINLPEWTAKLSPFGWIPQLPIESVNYLTLAVVTVISAVMAAAGFLFYRKRDVKA